MILSSIVRLATFVKILFESEKSQKGRDQRRVTTKYGNAEFTVVEIESI